MPEAERNAAEEPGFFDGRYLIDILSWDLSLHVGVSREIVPPEYRFQGGLDYARSFEIQGRIAAPVSARSQTVTVWLMPFGPDVKFDISDGSGVGILHKHETPYGVRLSAQLLIPEASIAPVATCLNSRWKFIHVWTFDDSEERAEVRAFSFSSTVHENLKPWITGKL